MTSKVAFTVLLVLAAGMALGKDKPSPQELLDAAHETADMLKADPYVLTATVVVNPGNKEISGALVVYRDREKARLDLQIAGRNETRVSIGKKDYVDPQRILLGGTWLNEFDRIWDPERPAMIFSQDKWRDVSRKTVGGVAAWCMERGKGPEKERLCVDAARNVVLSTPNEEFFDFAAMGALLFPQKIRINDPYGATVEVRDIKISSYAVETSLFAIPPHAIELETCADRTPTSLINAPIPVRSNLSAHATHGNVALFAFVDKQGRVISAQILTLVEPGFNARAIEAIKKWRFKPATCDGQPVNTGLTLQFSGAVF